MVSSANKRTVDDKPSSISCIEEEETRALGYSIDNWDTARTGTLN